MAVYNVHCLVHLAADSEKFSSLENIFLLFRLNFLHQLKRMVRKPTFPLSQVIRRLSEEESRQSERKADPILTKGHSKVPLPFNLEEGTYTQQLETCVLKKNAKYNCELINGKICMLNKKYFVRG